MNPKIKLIVGFRRDQEHSIDADEAHKAYYLFLNPEKRGVFKSGLAIVGADIKEIVPDYQGTMGWNPTHVMDSDDWNEVRGNGIAYKIPKLLAAAKDIAQLGKPEDLNQPLQLLIEHSYPQLMPKSVQMRGGSMKHIAELPPTGGIVPSKSA